jgi:hypothetical protein
VTFLVDFDLQNEQLHRAGQRRRLGKARSRALRSQESMP